MFGEKTLKERLYDAQFRRDESWYGDLIKATGVGTVFGLTGAYFARYIPNEFGAEAAIRGLTGASDGLGEGIFTLYRKVVRKRGMESTGWYATGKVFGAGLGVVSDYISRNFIDVYSKAASYVPALYSQGDQLVGPLFLLGYNFFQNSGNTGHRLAKSFKDPVVLTSLGVFGLSVGIVTLLRYFNEPNSRLEYFVENILLQPLCIAPPLIGRWIERRKRNSK